MASSAICQRIKEYFKAGICYKKRDKDRSKTRK